MLVSHFPVIYSMPLNHWKFQSSQTTEFSVAKSYMATAG